MNSTLSVRKQRRPVTLRQERAHATKQLASLLDLADESRMPTPAMLEAVGKVLAFGGVSAGFAALTLPRLHAEDFVEFQTMIRDAAAGLIDDGGCSLPGRLDDVRVTLVRRPDGTIARYFRGAHLTDWRPVALLLISDLFERAGAAVRRCQDLACGRLFVRLGRGEYHSKRCSQRVRSTKHYSGNRGEILKRRAKAYAATRQPARVRGRRATVN